MTHPSKHKQTAAVPRQRGTEKNGRTKSAKGGEGGFFEWVDGFLGGAGEEVGREKKTARKSESADG